LHLTRSGVRSFALSTGVALGQKNPVKDRLNDIAQGVLGNTVNIASRLETAVAKSGQIVVSDAVRQETDRHFTFEPIGERKLSGISQPVLTHRVTGKRG